MFHYRMIAFLGVGAAFALWWVSGPVVPSSARTTEPVTKASGDENGTSETLRRLPFFFVESPADAADPIRFSARAREMTVSFLPNAVAYALVGGTGAAGSCGTPLGAVVRMRFLGTEGATRLEGLGPRLASFNELRGPRDRWRTNVPMFGNIVYRDLYPGIDLIYRGREETLKAEWHVAPGADVSQIAWRYEGARSVAVTSGIRIETEVGHFEEGAPELYQSIEGRRVPVYGTFERRGSTEVGFKVEAYDPQYPLVIDPGLAWSTFIGGSDEDAGLDVAMDRQGNVYVGGYTYSPDFPVTPGAFDTTQSRQDGFVGKFDSRGRLLFLTLLGGSGNDGVVVVAVDEQQNIFVGGGTHSSDFPVTASALDTSFNGFLDGFVAKLVQSGDDLEYATYLGGSMGIDGILGLAVDRAGRAHVTGSTESPDFPITPGAFDTTFNDQYNPEFFWTDSFVSAIEPDGSALAYSTFLGGSGYGAGWDIAVDHAGDVFVAGQSLEWDFPVSAGAWDTALNGFEGYVVKLDRSGRFLHFGTFLGGSSGELASSLALDSSGRIVITGLTNSVDFPTTPGAFDSSFSGGFLGDAFVSLLDPTGSHLIASTYFGGTGSDMGWSIDLDELGQVYLAGATTSVDLPTTPFAFDRDYNGGFEGDVFIARLTADLTALTYGTFLGGSGSEPRSSPGRPVRLAVEVPGVVYVTSQTDSGDFPTTPGAFDTTYNGADIGASRGDAFLTKLRLTPLPRSPRPKLTR